MYVPDDIENVVFSQHMPWSLTPGSLTELSNIFESRSLIVLRLQGVNITFDIKKQQHMNDLNVSAALSKSFFNFYSKCVCARR